MASQTFQVSIFNLVTSLAGIVDIMCPAVGKHHLQVAYLAGHIARELGLPADEQYELTIAGALHDIGAFSLRDRLDLLEFEDDKPGEHSLAGYLLLRDFKPFEFIANIVKCHHIPWNQGAGRKQGDETVPLAGHIIHLADRMSVIISRDRAVLGQVPGIMKVIAKQRNSMFVSEHVTAALKLAPKDYIWLEVVSDALESILKSSTAEKIIEFDVADMLEFSWLICRLIDFKSEFTATHSSGVAATAVALAEKIGFSAHECRLIEIAAYLHDMGKLAIPSEILEKREKLDEDEWSIMRSHVYHTHRVLQSMDVFGAINFWSSLHQERLNGTGYPFGYRGQELPLGSRIMAVADVFTALTEDRPYRKGMPGEEARNILLSMARNEELDERLVNLLISNFDGMNALRIEAQNKADQEYKRFRSLLNQPADGFSAR